MDSVIKVDTNIEIMTTTSAKRFVFISDLHLDCFYKGFSHEELCENLEKMKRGIKVNINFHEIQEDDAFLAREDLFVQFANEHFANDILILAGDYYTDYRRTLSFVKKLESAKITSYFVLGNHDFASNNQTAFSDIIALFDRETSVHIYCKFLMTGKKYYHEDICIIGDTGWSSTSSYKVSARGSFTNKHFPNAVYVQEGKRWTKYAKGILKEEKKVLIVTHFPQAEFKQSSEHWVDWTSAKLHLKANNCWKIFGHTHQRGHFQHYNNVCLQQGYSHRGNVENSDYMHYSKKDFGFLEKATVNVPSGSFCIVTATDKVNHFYSTKLIIDPKKELEAVKSISRRGYMRVGNADNKRALAHLIRNKAEYILRVEEELKAVEFTEYIGYVLGERVSFRAVEAVKNAISILENVNPNNARAFMTAFVITSYVYNGMISFLESMRPVDDYDIMRWWMMFVTIQKFNISPDEIKSVKRNTKECLDFQNAPLYLPKVNDKSLKITEVRALLSNTSLLTDNRQPSSTDTPPKVNTKTTNVPESSFNVGDLVAHKTFGTGKIISLRTSATGTVLEIEFADIGIKNIMASYVKLESINSLQ